MDAKSLKALEAAEIIKFRGISGIETTAEIAMQAPELVQVHASSGNTYDLGRDGDGYRLIPQDIVYYWSETIGQFCTVPEN